MRLPWLAGWLLTRAVCWRWCPRPLLLQQVYRDGTTHYTPEVYKGLNVLLLNEHCGVA